MEDNFAKRKNVGPARTFGPPAPSDFSWCSLNTTTNELADNKNSHILPTGQWYAPSAVINDAWFSMVLHGIA